MTWWRDAVVYQIYPRSFCDSNADGVGDLNGVRRRLRYLEWLGIDAIWLSPIYPSPMRDFGYDVSNFIDVDPTFGSLADFDQLVREAHELGIRVLLDWVPNHTSSEHPWFLDARSSRTSAHRDWYIWRDAKADGSLPNNWIRAWSEESVWTWDELTGQYYLHLFLADQPDLNWSNPQVREAMAATLRFWLDRGVDGFRMDVVHALGKDLEQDDSEGLRMMSHTPLNDVEVTHEYLREIRRVLDEYGGERVSIGEVFLLDPARVATYYGDGDELHLSFNFKSLFTPWRANAWLDTVGATEVALTPVRAWPTWVLSNHDNARVATRLGGQERVRAAMTLLLTLRGTAFLYAGEELGLEDAVVAPEQVVDPGGRDGCRAPIPWNAEQDHGWPAGAWLPFVSEPSKFSVQFQEEASDSTLQFTRRLLALRRASRALRRGETRNLRADGDVLVFERVADDEVVRIVVNFAAARAPLDVRGTTLLFSSHDQPTPGELAANEAAIFKVG
ncbi:MAG TPA: alpha-amylase family glycosyl hydrolase [Acidimicrobiales bacterium]